MYAWTLLPKSSKSVLTEGSWQPESREIKLIYSLSGPTDCISLSAFIYHFEELCRSAGEDISQTVVMELSLEQRLETIPVLKLSDIVGFHEVVQVGDLYHVYTSVVSQQRFPTFMSHIVLDIKGNLYYNGEPVTGQAVTDWISRLQTTTPWNDMSLRQLWSTCSLNLIKDMKEMFCICSELNPSDIDKVTYGELRDAMARKNVIFFGKHGNVMYQKLDNLYKKDLYFQGRIWPSAENAYQAQKSTDLQTKELFIQYEPEYARFYGNLIDSRFDWYRVDEMFLFEVLEAKFEDPELRELLLSTGDALLVYDTTEEHDNIFGHCRCESCISRFGQNRLGEALMRLRAEMS